jgi:hypothetical protein
MRYQAFGGLLLGAGLGLASCAPSGPPAPIPAPLPETMSKPPVSATPMIWQPGHWNWTGSSYVWIPGQYVEAAGHGANWMPGWWDETDGSWSWRPGHWM